MKTIVRIILLTALTIKAATVFFDCPEKWFNCGDEANTCIAPMNKCDDYPDCPNGKDEVDCDDPLVKFHHIKCPIHHFNCNQTNRCLPLAWRCDHHKDCPKGDDEINCNSSDAHCDGFLCNDMNCIPTKWRCDNVPDCEDKSDEANCSKTNHKNMLECSKDNGFFECASTGHCIPHEKVCDNRTDCPKGDDEGSRCNENECKYKHCGQHCMNTSTGALCYCDYGYHLISDGKTCVDIDECQMIHDGHDMRCTQKCRNVPGNYVCDCFNGYILAEDKHNCEADGEEPILFFSDSSKISGLKLRSREYFNLHNAVTQSRGVDVFGKSQRVYWLDYNLTQSVVYSCDRTGQNLQPIISSGLHTPEALAVDWLAGNIYVTDSGLNVIIVCDKDGVYCKELHKGQIGKVRAIALDPPNGVMFWTDWGKEPGIYTSPMDGTGLSALVKNDIIWPKCLTLDSTTGRLYWADAKLKQISYFEFHNNNRHILLEFGNTLHPYSMTVFENKLFWSDAVSQSLVVANKFNGRNRTILLRTPENFINDLHVYHPVIQRDSGISPCEFNRCSHLCLLVPHRKSVCGCPDHMILESDLKTCTLKTNSAFLIVGIDRTVTTIYPDTISEDVVYDLKIPSYISISGFTFDQYSQKMFYVGQLRNEIFLINMTDRHPNESSLYKTSHFTIQSLTYEKQTNILYWLESQKGELKASSTDGKRVSTLITKMDTPVNLAVHPEKGRIFIALLGENPHILVAGMDGRDARIFVKNVGYPVSLFVSKVDNKLYWADVKRGTIESIDLFENFQQTTKRVTIRVNLQNVMSIVVHKNLVYWTAMDDSYFYHPNLGDYTSKSTLIPLTAHLNESTQKSIQLVTFESYQNPCKVESKECSHLCLLSEVGPKCLCSDGYVISKDGKTCERVSMSFTGIINYLLTKIKRVNIEDNVNFMD